MEPQKPMPGEHITEEVARKKLNEMNLINGFLFDSVLENQEDAIKVTQAILTTTFNRVITVVNVTSQRTYNGVDSDMHGIRLDAQIIPQEDGTLAATIFDVYVIRTWLGLSMVLSVEIILSTPI